MNIKITTWDKVRNWLGFGFSKKTEAALEVESKRQVAILKEFAEARLKDNAKAKPVKDAENKKPATKKAPAKKPAAKTPAKKAPATKKATPKKGK